MVEEADAAKSCKKTGDKAVENVGLKMDTEDVVDEREGIAAEASGGQAGMKVDKTTGKIAGKFTGKLAGKIAGRIAGKVAGRIAGNH